MRDKPILSNGDVIVRLAEPSDVAEVHRFFSAYWPGFSVYVPTAAPDAYTLSFWERELVLYQEEYEQEKSCRMFIFEASDNRTVIGMLNLNDLARGAAFQCRIGYTIAPDQEGRGRMYAACKLCIDFAFGPLNLHRIEAQYVRGNIRSAKLLERLGFHTEGICRDYLFVHGRWQDHVQAALLNPAWRNPAVASS
ncbi:GNAT family N-acetyltransferase [Parachitinimonas caeni]|uniref:GNAT family N-acetyltransferase n=1 Tax=Parachitinimonas caeni TaxID=3031301 RepID=A0ABT7DUB5_9NEIS|nr:GNAT family N-acetyltransferase [Parachitinimonas caeni]MDK2123658.1 GNAT family N-acetyltransferase [Parachitinimonas caeni]